MVDPLPHDCETWAEFKQHRGGRRLTLSTREAVFDLNLVTGAWGVVDRHGLQVFASPAGGLSTQGRGTRLDLRLADRESLHGLGETTGTFNHRGAVREFWNRDVLGHSPAIHPGLPSLYVAIPMALSLRDGRAAGLFWDHPGHQRWDLGAGDPGIWRMTAREGGLELYLFTGPRPAAVLEAFTRLTGRTPMPPRWALGYQQARYSYASAAELESVAREFRRRRLPCDVLYCDIHHMNRYRVFTFGRSYPDPKGLMARLRRRGFRVIPIVDPGVKDEPRFGVLRRGQALDAFVRAPGGGQDFVGEAWPGACRFPDFLRSEVREWWGREQRTLLDLGAAGAWNDMNEPANFARPDKTLDPDCLHQTDLGPARHAGVHNAYGLQMARASYEGAVRAEGRAPEAIPRPLIVTRAGYAGVQRYAAVWTGDNSSTWEHLDESVRQLLNLGLSGVPFVGADVGGFLGDATPELFVRWLQVAVFTPFLRNHSNLGTRRQEPWAFGREVETLARGLLELRYQLLPWMYALFAEAARGGAPVMRPLLWHYPNDEVAAACTDQFLLGENLMVAPILRAGAVARAVYLPKGEWFDFFTGALYPGGYHAVVDAPLARIPVFVRAGSLIPIGPVRPHVGTSEPETLALHVWPGSGGRLEWYDDDGHSLAHTSGAWQRRTLTATYGPRAGSLTLGAPTGSYRGPHRRWRVVLREAGQAVRVRIRNQPIPSEWSEQDEAVWFDLPMSEAPVEVRWSATRAPRTRR